jgi:hypothetical protein
MASRSAASGFVAAALLALLAAPLHAVDYYVQEGGSDGADGLTPATAWATLVHAAEQAGPGDTVHVADGDYQGFYLTTSGTPGSPIHFLAEGSAVRITEDNPTTPDGINLEGASHVIVEGFVVDGRTRAGIRAVLADHVTIRGNRLGYNGRWGILTGFVDDLLAEGNEAHHSQIEHGIYVSNSADRPVVRGNHLHDNRANGLHMNGDASLGGDGLIEDALVEGNVIHGNGVGGGSGINLDGGVGALIRNNLLYDNHASGISLYRIDGGAPSTGNVVVNNTVVNAANGRWCINIRDGSTGNTVRNNVLYNHDSFRGAISADADSLAGMVSDYNALVDRFTTDGGDSVMDLAEWQDLGFDAHSTLATPEELFLIPGSDFRLLPGGPAVDTGVPTGAPDQDLDGAPRPVGGGFDLGAYELQFPDCGDGDLDPPEACETDGECAEGESCLGCTCIAPPLCSGGAALEKARLKLEADGSFRLDARAVLPGAPLLDPPGDGLRLVVADAFGTPVLDVALDPGAPWISKGARWSYAGDSVAIRKATLRDQGAKTPGLVKLSLRGEAGALALPDPAGLETTVVLAPGSACAALTWNPPAAPRPRCRLKGSRVACR